MSLSEQTDSVDISQAAVLVNTLLNGFRQSISSIVSQISSIDVVTTYLTRITTVQPLAATGLLNIGNITEKTYRLIKMAYPKIQLPVTSNGSPDVEALRNQLIASYQFNKSQQLSGYTGLTYALDNQAARLNGSLGTLSSQSTAYSSGNTDTYKSIERTLQIAASNTQNINSKTSSTALQTANVANDFNGLLTDNTQETVVKKAATVPYEY